MDVAIPPPKHKDSETPTGYDIPRDTISKEFIKSARTARQSVESNGSFGAMSDYLIPSTSSKLVPDTPPRIVVTSPDDEPLPSPFGLKMDKEILSRMNHNRHGTDTPPPTDHSFLLAVAMACGVVLIVIFLIYLFFKV
ncbi:unnamed protein product, partial [Cylicocyclus nassatus]